MKKTDILKLLPLETERLTIHPSTLNDVDKLQEAMRRRDKELRKWMSWSSDEGLSRQGTLGYIQNGVVLTNTLDIPLIAVDKINSRFVLATGLHAKDEDFKALLTGWWIDKDYEGKGMAFEAMTALNNLSFNIIGTQTIEAEYYEDNIRSRNLIERLGFKYKCTKLKSHCCHLDGHMMDIHKYILEQKNHESHRL